MRVAIVCNGPSAREMVAKHRPHMPQLVIAVNGGAEICEHDFWVVGDGEALQLYKGAPKIMLVHQFHDWAQWCNEHNLQWAEGMPSLHWDEMRCDERHPYGGPWHWTDQAAVAMAAKIGATHVEMYGADYAGDDTAPTGKPQVANRWERQLTDLEAILAWTGITLTRILPGGNVEHPLNRMATPANRGRGRLPLAEQMARDSAPPAVVEDGVIKCPTCSQPMIVYKTDAERGLRYVRCKKNGHKHTLRGGV